jgi:hypothetical protein
MKPAIAETENYCRKRAARQADHDRACGAALKQPAARHWRRAGASPRMYFTAATHDRLAPPSEAVRPDAIGPASFTMV